MKLQAVTVCINYSDYLECILENRAFFDRWVIVTAREDAATIAFCARHGLECILSETLKADGSDFDATRNKSSIINEGLEALDPDGWCLILDADVRLPREFRRRLEALTLESGAIYGPTGRRVIEEREKFNMLMECEPWDRFQARYSGIIGFFQLFDLEATPNRYWPSIPVGEGPGDDDQFQYMFPDLKRLKVPMSVIHVGAAYANWTGRKTELYVGETRAGSVELPVEVSGTAAVVGYFPGGPCVRLLPRFEKVWLVDHFGVHARSPSVLLEADRAVLRQMWDEETRTLTNLELAGVQSEANLERIPDDSLDFLYLSGEVTPDWLCDALPLWMPKLKAGAIIAGELYGLPHWPDSTYAAALLLGPPDAVGADGSWWKRVRSEKALPIVPRIRQREADGVAFVNSGKDQLESLMLGIFSARKHWSGAIQVFQHGPSDDSLRCLCALLGVELRHVSEEHGNMERLVQEIAEISPFKQGLFLSPRHLVCGPLDLGSMRKQRGELAGAVRAIADGEWNTKCAPAMCEAAARWSADEGGIVFYEGDVETWTEDAWEARCIVESELAAAIAVEVRIPADTTIVAFVTLETAAEFQRNWLTWKFPDGTPVVLILDGVNRDEFWLPETNDSVRVIETHSADVSGLLRLAGDACGTKRVLFLPAGAIAMPGAELWPGEAGFAAHGSKAAQAEIAVTGNEFTPDHGFALLQREQIMEVARSLEGTGTGLERFPGAVYRLRDSRGNGPLLADVKKLGWKFSSR